ncbi:hypothetical protein CERZMDRAFT_99429 [Cercospora zeae-maydis SCOH1-5]|uniref:RING-type domain-containing protein n=1 Tax=Cercospora zeae-maydis SCOH1-5 TaxID=717836 RepID=A0A6A6FAF0_9PEZI|nr:hypothetical protein CERZMDRAFT_99429 [Cercospora zeae-maydis SCOH1-5]
MEIEGLLFAIFELRVHFTNSQLLYCELRASVPPSDDMRTPCVRQCNAPSPSADPEIETGGAQEQIIPKQAMERQHSSSNTFTARKPPRSNLICFACGDSLSHIRPIKINNYHCCHACFDRPGAYRAQFEAFIKGGIPKRPQLEREDIDFDACSWLFSEEFAEAFRRKLPESECPAELRLYCARVDCGAFLGPRNKHKPKENACVCGAETCPRCRTMVADRMDGEVRPTSHHCAKYGRNEALDGLVRGVDYQYCPCCRWMIELEKGCNHMTCERNCGTEFCFLCGRKANQRSSHWDSGAPCHFLGTQNNPYAGRPQYDPEDEDQSWDEKSDSDDEIWHEVPECADAVGNGRGEAVEHQPDAIHELNGEIPEQQEGNDFGVDCYTLEYQPNEDVKQAEAEHDMPVDSQERIQDEETTEEETLAPPIATVSERLHHYLIRDAIGFGLAENREHLHFMNMLSTFRQKDRRQLRDMFVDLQEWAVAQTPGSFRVGVWALANVIWSLLFNLDYYTLHRIRNVETRSNFRQHLAQAYPLRFLDTWLMPYRSMLRYPTLSRIIVTYQLAVDGRMDELEAWLLARLQCPIAEAHPHIVATEEL